MQCLSSSSSLAGEYRPTAGVRILEFESPGGKVKYTFPLEVRKKVLGVFQPLHFCIRHKRQWEQWEGRGKRQIQTLKYKNKQHKTHKYMLVVPTSETYISFLGQIIFVKRTRDF